MFFQRLNMNLIIIIIFLFNETNLILTNEIFNKYVEQVASAYHSDWRQTFHKQNPTIQNRFKLTKSKTNYQSSDFIYPMILTVGSCLVHRNLKVAQNRLNHSLIYVDILNMNYNELPFDWAEENRETARLACQLILKSIRTKKRFNQNLIENLSKRIHFHWMKRNFQRTKKELLVSYQFLTDFEKLKDRKAILIACQIYNQFQFYQIFQTDFIQISF